MNLCCPEYRPHSRFTEDYPDYDEQVWKPRQISPFDHRNCEAVTEDSLSEAIRSLIIMPPENANPPEELAQCTDEDAIDGLLDKLKRLGLVTKEPEDVICVSHTAEGDVHSDVAMRPRSALKANCTVMLTREYKIALLRKFGWNVADTKCRRLKRQLTPSSTNTKALREGLDGSGVWEKRPNTAGCCPLVSRTLRLRKPITKRSRRRNQH